MAELPTDEQRIIVNRMLLTCLTRAEYRCIEDNPIEEMRHYGLNFDLYTHFTSPIRRYADLIVHRLLNICLANDNGPKNLPDYSDQVGSITTKALNAKNASKGCQTLFHCLLIREYGNQAYESIVFNVDDDQK